MKIRKVNLKAIFYKTILYRIFIIFIQAIFTLLLVKSLSFKQAFNISILWNSANVALYFIYEFLFSKKYDTTIQTKGAVVWFTGLPCSGKTTLADAVAIELKKLGKNAERLDGDIVRKGKLSDDLGFSKEDRDKNINRINFVSSLLSRNNTIVLASFVSPYRETRNKIRSSVTNFIEIFVDCYVGECRHRDIKGMWKKAVEGKIKGFTGWDDPYEKPTNAEVICKTDKETLEESVQKVMDYLRKEKLI